MKKSSIISLILVISFGLAVFFFGKSTTDLIEKAKSCRQQLIAVCGAVDEALRDAGIKKEDVNIFVRWLDREKPAVCIALKQGEITHTAFHDGQVIIRRPGGWEGQTIRRSWEDYTEFHSLGKK